MAGFQTGAPSRALAPSKVESVRGSLKLLIERDPYFKARQRKEVIKRYRQERGEQE